MKKIFLLFLFLISCSDLQQSSNYCNKDNLKCQKCRPVNFLEGYPEPPECERKNRRCP
jgi:hypothetical protein